MTDLTLIRQRHDGMAVQGELHRAPAPGFLCYTLELPWRGNERGRSCIPTGRWPLRLRGEGGFYERYTELWEWHQEIVEVVVDGRDYILFHTGNTHHHTDGCILVGEQRGYDTREGADGALAVWGSRDAYREVYPVLRACAASGGHLEVIDGGSGE